MIMAKFAGKEFAMFVTLLKERLMCFEYRKTETHLFYVLPQCEWCRAARNKIWLGGLELYRAPKLSHSTVSFSSVHARKGRRGSIS